MRIPGSPASISNNRMITPQAFGAKADGVTDDYEAISAAIQKAIALKKPLYIPAGTYAISQTLNIGGHIVIYGDAGSAPRIDDVGNCVIGSILHYTGEGAAIKIHTDETDTILFPKVRMKDICIINKGKGLYGLQATRTIFSLFENITCIDFKESGFHFESDRVYKEDSEIKDGDKPDKNGNVALPLPGATIYNNTFNRCYAYNSNYGFFFKGICSDTEFNYCGAYYSLDEVDEETGEIITGYGQSGFYIAGMHGVDGLVDNRHATNDLRLIRFSCGRFNYGIHKAENCIVRNIHIEGADLETIKEKGIFIHRIDSFANSKSVYINGCYFKNVLEKKDPYTPAGHGIYLDGVNDGLITNCTFEANVKTNVETTNRTSGINISALTNLDETTTSSIINGDNVYNVEIDGKVYTSYKYMAIRNLLRIASRVIIEGANSAIRFENTFTPGVNLRVNYKDYLIKEYDKDPDNEDAKRTLILYGNLIGTSSHEAQIERAAIEGYALPGSMLFEQSRTGILGKPIWWDGEKWINALGETVYEANKEEE